jgi:hypothetical protein
MSCWEVKDYLGQLVDFNENESDIVLDLCRTSLKEIEALLKPDADRGDMRIVAAAAGTAYYKLMLKRSAASSAEEVTGFKAGDVSITQKSTNDDAQKQLEKAEKFCSAMMSKLVPLCEDNSFAFKQVEVMNK